VRHAEILTLSPGLGEYHAQFLAEQLMKNAILPPGFREDGAKPAALPAASDLL